MTDLQFKVNVEEVLAALDSVKAGLVTVKTEQEQVNSSGKNLFAPLEKSLEDLNSEVAKGIDKAKDMKAAKDADAKATSDLSKKIKDASKEINIFGFDIAASTDEIKSKVIAVKSLIVSIYQAIPSYKQIGQAVRNAYQQIREFTFKGFISGVKQSIAGIPSFISGLGGVRSVLISITKIPIVLLISAIVAGLAALVTAFTRSQGNADKFRQVLAGVSAVVDVVLDRISKIGEVVIKVFQGDFKGAANEAKQALKGLNDEIEREFKLAKQLEEQAQRLRSNKLNFKIVEANELREIERLKGISEDVTKSFTVRQDAYVKANSKAKALINQQIKDGEDEIANLLDVATGYETIRTEIEKVRSGQAKLEDVSAKFSISPKSREELEAIADVIADLSSKEETLFGKQTELTNGLNSLQQERADKVKQEQEAINQLRDKYNDLAAVLAGQLDEAQTEQLTKEEQIIKARDKSIAQLAELKKELLGIAAQLKAKGVAVNVDVDQAISEIEQQIRNRAERELNAAFDTQPLALPPIKITPLTVADPRQQVEQLAQNLADNVADTSESFAEQLQGIGESIGEFNFFTDILNIDASTEQGKAEIEALKKAGEQTIAIVNNIAAARFEAANKAVEAADREVDAREQALETELRLAELGFASNVSLRQQELEEARKAQDQALADQRKAAKAQLVIETVTQSINLITSSTNIIKGFSAIPIIGLPLGIAAVAAMFVAFAKAKADAFKAASAGAQFEQGGGGYVGKDGVIVGKRHRSGGVPLEVEGGEFFATDGSRFGVVNRRMTDKHFNLLQAINLDDKGGMSRAMMDMLAVPGINYGYFDAMHRRDDEVRAGNVAVNIDLEAMRENNRLMSEFLEWQRQQTKVQEYPGHRIETTGNRTRIIRKAQA